MHAQELESYFFTCREATAQAVSALQLCVSCRPTPKCWLVDSFLADMLVLRTIHVAFEDWMERHLHYDACRT
jgi:hypothetical protein